MKTAGRRRVWVLNEKKLVEQAGLQDLHAKFTDVPTSSPELVTWVDGRSRDDGPSAFLSAATSDVSVRPDRLVSSRTVSSP